MADNLPPIIIKRIKKISGGHHGGAWKVAYADFVTAMMAFFLLLWLLNVTSPETRAGIADYFTPTIGIKDSAGIGFRGGQTDSEKGISKSNLAPVGIVVGQVKQGPTPDAPTDQPPVKPDENAESTAAMAKGENNEDADQFKQATEQIAQSLRDDPELKDYQQSVVVQDSPEGMKIDLIDDAKKPMFVPGGAQLTDMGKKVLDSMANIVSKTPNNITIIGHTDSAGATANPNYTNWELSVDRANASRKFLSTTQLEGDRVAKIIGLADRELLVPQEPTSPRNRRVTIIIMRGSYFRDPKSAPTTRTLLSTPSGPAKKEAPKPVEAPPPAPDPLTALPEPPPNAQ
jgi:chemotaxis protein MotB